MKIPGCTWQKALRDQSRFSDTHTVPKQMLQLNVDKIKSSNGSHLKHVFPSLIIDLRDTDDEGGAVIDDFQYVGENITCYTIQDPASEQQCSKSSEKQCVTECGIYCIASVVSEGPSSSPSKKLNGFIYKKDIKKCFCYQDLDAFGGEDSGAEDNDLCYQHTPGSKAAQKLMSRTVRFQYDGELALKKDKGIQIINDNIVNPNCNRCGGNECNELSKHVVTTAQVFTMKLAFTNILIKDAYGSGKHLTCNIVNDQIEIVNNIGPSADRVIKMKSKDELSEQKIELASKCNEGCVFDVTYSEGDKVSVISEAFLAGPPIDNVDKRKKMYVKHKSKLKHTLEFVITGDELLEGARSVQYPINKPLLVLRDPPGGDSYVKYDNMHTTAHIRHETLESYEDYERQLAAMSLADKDLEGCVGFGVSACSTTADAESEGGDYWRQTGSKLIEYHESSQTFRFSSSWSYSTSQEVEYAGKESDVALVPNIDVKYETVRETSWDSALCKAIITPRQKYLLTSDENKAAFSFVTFENIENEIIPNLEASLAQTKTDIAAETNVKKKQDLEQAEVFLIGAIDSWKSFVKSYEETTQSLVHKVNEWFTLEDASGEEELDMESKEKVPISKKQWAGMVPKDFDLRKKKLDNLDSSMTDKMEDFEDINRIYFSGGGGSMELHLSLDQSIESQFLPGNPNAELSEEWAMQKLLMEKQQRVRKPVPSSRYLAVDITDASFKERRDRYIQTAKHKRPQGSKQIISEAEENVASLIKDYEDKVKELSDNLTKNSPKSAYQKKAQELSAEMGDKNNLNKVKDAIKSEASEAVEGATKETAEQASERATKESSREIAEKVSNDALKVEDMTKVGKEAAQETAEEAAKDAVEKSAKTTAKQIAEEAGIEFAEGAGESFTKKVATDIGDEIAEDAAKKVVIEGGNEVTERLVKETSKEIMTEVTTKAAAEVTEQVTQEVSEKVTREIADEIAEKISKKVAKEVSEEVSEKLAEQLSKKIAKEISEELTEKFVKKAAENVDKAAKALPNVGGIIVVASTTFNMFKEAFADKNSRVNQDWMTSLGTDGDVALSLFGFGFNVEAEEYLSSRTSDRAFEGTSTESSSSVSLFLGDPNPNDEFVLDIYLDPIYKTFVFKVLSGISSCPWEGPPLQRLEDPQLSLSGPSQTFVPENQPIIFKVEMSNKQNTDKAFRVPLEVLLDPSSNVDDLRVEMFGTDLQNPHQMNFDGTNPIEATIAVYRGPIKHSYGPLKISLRSQCEAPFPITTSKNEKILELSNKGAELSYDQPCPMLSWAGVFRDEKKFVINKKLSNTDYVNGLPVTVHNLNSKTKLSTIPELKHVKLYFRSKGETIWHIGTTKNSKEEYIADFKDVEDSYGYASLNWDYGADLSTDGMYDLKIKAECTGAGSKPNEYESFSLEIIEVIYDTEPASVYGQLSISQQKSVSVDEEVKIDFSEDIQCTKPYTFKLEIEDKTGDGSKLTTLTKRQLQILCKEDTIRFYIEGTKRTGWKGKQVKLTVSKIKDLAGNVMVHPFEFEFSFSGTRRQLIDKDSNRSIKGTGCDGIDQNYNGVIDDCEEDASPPSVSLHGAHVFKNRKYSNASYLPNPTFSSVKDAKDFLAENIVVSDDCANDLDVDITSSDALCHETLFEIKVTDLICGELNPVQTLTRRYLLRVDDTAPTVSLGFHSMSKLIFYEPKKKILVIEESRKSLMNVNFWHTIEVSKTGNAFNIFDLTKIFHYIG